MSSITRRIGVTTGGGDCPGLNAVLRAMVLRAEQVDAEIIGIEDGFDGLLRDTRRGTRKLTCADVDDILDRGGTILGTTNRGNPFGYLDASGNVIDRSAEVVSQIRELGIDVLVTIGGDGTQTIALQLEALGVPVIGVPKTIDNDLQATYETFGFGTAVQVVTEALDRLRTTAESHERIMILEVMGRTAGWIALHAGVAGGAQAILIPEIPYDPAIVAKTLRSRSIGGRPFALVVVAEGSAPKGGAVSHKEVMGKALGQATALGGAGAQAASLIAHHMPEHEFRVTVLGHIQRGGTPTAADRLLATRLGVEAVDTALRGEHKVLMSWQPPEIVAVELTQMVQRPRLIDPASQLVMHARRAGTCFGD